MTTIVPIVRANGIIDYLTHDEIAAAANLVEEATGSEKNSYTPYPCDPKITGDKLVASLEAIPSSAFFRYRTTARRCQVMTEIAK